MKENCQHNRIKIVEENSFDKIGVCEDCGLKVSILSLKDGLYAMVVGEKNYIINSVTDMNFENHDYHFQLRGTNQKFHLYKNQKTNQIDNTSCKRLCKNMKK